jgi:LysR family nitrogen assimilation transcriptional regulator
MDIKQMRYFLAVVDAGSFSEAARRLRVAQPALSQSLRRLEEDLGSALLHRLSRGVAVTEEGATLAREGRRMVAEWEGLSERIRALGDDPSGELSIGVPTSLSRVVSLPLVELLCERLPRVRPRIVEGLSGHILAWLREGTIDLGLVFNGEEGADLAVEPLATESLALVVPRGDPAPDQVTLAEAAARPLILPGAPHGLRAEVERAFAAAGVVPRVPLEIDALDHIVALVARGRGCSIVSPRVARQAPEGRGVRVLSIVDPPITRSIGLAHARTRAPSIALRHGLVLVRPLVTELVLGAVDPP